MSTKKNILLWSLYSSFCCEICVKFPKDGEEMKKKLIQSIRLSKNRSGSPVELL